MQERRPKVSRYQPAYDPVLLKVPGSHKTVLLLDEADDAGLTDKKTKIQSILDVIRSNIAADEARETTRAELDSFSTAIGKLSLPIFHSEPGEHNLDFATRLARTKSELADVERLVSNTFPRACRSTNDLHLIGLHRVYLDSYPPSPKHLYPGPPPIQVRTVNLFLSLLFICWISNK